MRPSLLPDVLGLRHTVTLNIVLHGNALAATFTTCVLCTEPGDVREPRLPPEHIITG
ncbi:MAG: hypothetical protein VX749_02200 [Pseudomonadota bacterium]|nr:hypothetical protein [Pseudomonadota bacterium]